MHPTELINPRSAVTNLMPASPAQDAILVSSQFHPTPQVYWIAKLFRLNGIYSSDDGEKALSRIMATNPQLGCRFVEHDGRFAKLPTASASSHIKIFGESHLIDLTDSPDDIQAFLVDATDNFTVHDSPLFQLLVLSQGLQENILCFLAHRLVADESHLESLIQEFIKAYQAADVDPSTVQDNGIALPFTDSYTLPETLPFAISEHRADEYQPQIDFWRSKLATPLPAIDLPIANTRPAQQTYSGRRYRFAIPEDLTNELSCTVDGHEMANMLLALFECLIYRYSGQSDLLIGGDGHALVKSGYLPPNHSPSVGKNTDCATHRLGKQAPGVAVAYRNSLDGEKPFNALFSTVEKTVAEASENQGIPLELLLQGLNLPRDYSRPPLCQLWFQMLPAELHFSADGAFNRIDYYPGLTQFDLSLYIQHAQEGLSAYFEYNTDLFSESVIQRFSQHYLAMLSNVIDNPNAPIDRLAVLTPEERTKILAEWNQTHRPLPEQTTLHSLFEKQASLTPHKTAVRFGEQTLSYAELNHRASLLSAYLQRSDRPAGAMIGIHVERSLDMMVGLLAVLKSGGCYVPLDPSFPSDRLAYMVEDAGISTLLTQHSLLTHLFPHQATVICLDADWPSIEDQVGGTSPLDQHLSMDSTSVQQAELGQVDCEDLAYVIYTSGSTGKPKGVQISHRAAVNFLLTMAEQPGIHSDDTLVAVTTLSFDIALLELFLPLTCGAEVAVASREEASDAALLRQLLATSNATILQATPATWRMLLDDGWAGRPGLRALCGGEAFPADLAERLLGCCDSVWNMYGPTETTVWSTIHEVEAATVPILIGRPIANTETYILDNQLQPVPVGVPGVLYIGGKGLAEGYLNRLELTNEKFIPHPFADELGNECIGAKIYNTGDMAKYHEDGTIECLGRIDHQVKIRGFRIELGEIETLLSEHPKVAQTIVVAREDTPGSRVLVAYVTSSGKVDIKTLRSYLKAELPDYMVPTAFVFLDEFPLTPNGKINRLALPEPTVQRAVTEEELALPRNETEQYLVNHWEELLNVHPISIHDDFFEIGGTSLIAVRLFRKIEQEFEVRLPLATLFDASSIAELAKVISGDLPDARRGKALVRIRQGSDSTRPPLIMCHGAGGAVLLYRALALHLSPEQTVYGLQAIGLDSRIEPHTSIEEMVDHYMDEVLAMQPRGPYLIGGYCMGGSIALELAQRLRQRGEEVALLAMLETYNWFNGTELAGKKKLIHTLEKIEFHVRNLLLSDRSGKRLFFKDKFDELARRVRMSVGQLSGTHDDSLPQKVTELEDENAFATTSRVWDVNDEASLVYQPAQYPGRITHIITRKQYSCYAGVHMGWANYADEGVDSVVLNVYPAGMLNEPFVQELAHELQTRIDELLDDGGIEQAVSPLELPPLAGHEEKVDALRIAV